jgi:vancomycin permeability regulator SanA
MYRKCALASALIVALAAPAFAAEFYVAQSAADKKCSVVEAKPDGKTAMMVGKASYKSKDEADKAMKAATECKK